MNLTFERFHNKITCTSANFYRSKRVSLPKDSFCLILRQETLPSCNVVRSSQRSSPHIDRKRTLLQISSWLSASRLSSKFLYFCEIKWFRLIISLHITTNFFSFPNWTSIETRITRVADVCKILTWRFLSQFLVRFFGWCILYYNYTTYHHNIWNMFKGYN